MIIGGYWQVFLVGAFGGLLVELLRWWKLREVQVVPHYSNSVFYWVVTVLMIAAGGALALLHGIADQNALTTLNIGASAPAFIAAVAAAPPKPPGRVAEGEAEATDAPGPANADTASADASLLGFLAFGG